MTSSFMLQSLLISGLAYLAYLFIEFRNRAIGTIKRVDSSFPDLRGWPLIGQLPQMIITADRFLEAGAIMASKLGVGVSITLPGIRIIDISKPEWIEYVQKTKFNNFEKGSFFKTRMVDLFGLSTLVTDGAAWKRSRLVISRIFHVNAFKEIIEPSSNESMSGLLRVLRNSSEENRGVDFCTLFSRYNLELLVKMTFGSELGLFSRQNQPSGESFSQAFDFSQKHMDFRFNTLNGWEWYEKINSGVGSRMKSACRTIHGYALHSIDERLSKIASIDDLNDEEKIQKDFLGRIMAAHYHQGNALQREELRDDCLSLLFAGRDATAQSLSWCFFHLLMNQDIISRIREETSLISGSGQDEELVTHENYKKFIFTNAVLLEAIRLHPAVPKNMKFAVAADKMPNGPVIQAGDCLTWSNWQMARDPALWGPDCGKFQPDRWIDEAGKIKNFGNFKFQAFNGGPRLCVGMNMSIFIAVKVIVEILHNFDLQFCDGWFENVPKCEELEGVETHYSSPQYQASMTLPMKNPMMITVKPRLAL